MTNVDTYLTAANAAIDDLDWVTAERKLIQAKVEMEGIPDSRVGDVDFRLRQSKLENLLEYVGKMKREASTTQNTLVRVNVNRVRPGAA